MFISTSRFFAFSMLAFVLRANAVNAAADDAELFLRHIYAPYVAGNTHVDVTGKIAPTIFNERLTALIRKDQENAKGEVGALDEDPICNCQDFDRLKSLNIIIKEKNSSHAMAVVSFMNGKTRTSLIFTLVNSQLGWRVQDIGSENLPSLVNLLEQADTAQ